MCRTKPTTIYDKTFNKPSLASKGRGEGVSGLWISVAQELFIFFAFKVIFAWAPPSPALRAPSPGGRGVVSFPIRGGLALAPGVEP